MRQQEHPRDRRGRFLRKGRPRHGRDQRPEQRIGIRAVPGRGVPDVGRLARLRSGRASGRQGLPVPFGPVQRPPRNDGHLGRRRSVLRSRGSTKGTEAPPSTSEFEFGDRPVVLFEGRDRLGHSSEFELLLGGFVQPGGHRDAIFACGLFHCSKDIVIQSDRSLCHGTHAKHSGTLLPAGATAE
jgi:hypothetical protein